MYPWNEAEAMEHARRLGVPEYMLEGLNRWVEHGRHAPPGSFLSAVISNDLRRAVEKADDHNRFALPAYVTWFYNYAPIACWGSPLALKTWPGLKHLEEDPTDVTPITAE